MDTSWNTYNIESNQEFKITSPKTVQCADELNDIPNPPESYGMACWLKNDEGILIYDRYDIWKVDAENKTIPVNITKNGRLNNISYRLIDFDNIYQRSIGEGYLGHNSMDEFLLLGHNEITRNEGYYQLSGIGSNFPDPLIVGSFKLNRPIKSKDAQVLVYTKETFELFPDLLITENNFKKSKSISKVNPQQQEFLWGTKELYSWTSLDGRK